MIPNFANFTSPLCIIFDLNLLLLHKSALGSARRKFILSAWLIVIPNTAAAGGYQCCSVGKKKTHNCNFNVCLSLSRFEHFWAHCMSFLTPGLLKPVKIPLCYFRNVAHGRLWDNGHSFSAFRTKTQVFFPQMHGFPLTTAYVVKIGRCGNIRRPACQAWVMAICTAR